MYLSDRIGARMHLNLFWLAFVLCLIEVGWMFTKIGWFIFSINEAPVFQIEPLIFIFPVLISSIISISYLYFKNPTNKDMILSSIIAVAGIAISNLSYGPFMILATLNVIFSGFSAPFLSLSTLVQKNHSRELSGIASLLGFLMILTIIYFGPIIFKNSKIKAWFLFWSMIAIMVAGVAGCVQSGEPG